jgi:hypothetical protein
MYRNQASAKANMQNLFSVPQAILYPYTTDQIRDMVIGNKRLACEIIHAVWLVGQMDDEKVEGSTIHLNGIGFNVYDAAFLSNLAEQIADKGWESMSDGENGQTRWVFKYASKYAKQAAALLSLGATLKRGRGRPKKNSVL